MAIPDVSAEKLEEAFDHFDQTQRTLPIFQNWESNENYRYAVLRNGRRYPPKEIIAFATGLSKDSLSGGIEGANVYLQKQGCTIEALRFPVDSVLQAALHDLLLLRAPEPVEPSEAYEVLSKQFGLSAELRQKLMENQDENHWENRIRGVRRKLVDQDIVDPSERGVWKLQRRNIQRIWIEKTLVKDRPDRLTGEHALGKALWSPTRAKDGSDIYHAMRFVQPGDRILHLTDNTAITGVSVVEDLARPDFQGVPGTSWGGQASYRVPLKDFSRLAPPLGRDDFLENHKYRQELIDIRKSHSKIFYDRDLNLNQGSYLTDVPPRLLSVINDSYKHLTGRYLINMDFGLEPDLQCLDIPKQCENEAPPHVWVYSPGERAAYWDEFRESQIAAIGWDELGDLSKLEASNDIFAAMVKIWDEPSKINATQCFEFSHRVQPGDWIFAKRGRREIIGFGVVKSTYRFEGGRSHSRHVVDVDWQKVGIWPTQSHRTLPMKTLTDITGDETLIDELEQMLALADASGPAAPSDEPLPLYSLDSFVAETRITPEMAERWRQRLQRKQQLIFQGPPGTGKTFVAERLARLLASGTPGLIETIQFHPSYGYEDFMHGIRPVIQPDGQMAFERQPGRFLRFCKDARAVRDGAPCILIIDEINRGNLARIFGELMYLLEYRGKQIPLAGEAAPFGIPDNVYIIGTMNTADRSIAVVDHALRRRFSFIHLAPDYEVLHRHITDFDLPADALVAALRTVNTAINDRNYEVGISFFLKDGSDLRARLKDVWEGEIEPYLEEYFYDQPGRLDALRWHSLTSGVLAPWVNVA